MTEEPRARRRHLVVLKYTERYPGGPWRVFLFEGKKRMFRVDFRRKGPAEFLAAKIVSELRANGWECQWSVQDEDERVGGTDVSDAAKQVVVRCVADAQAEEKTP